MFRLPQTTVNSLDEESDVDGNIPTYYLIRKESAVCSTFDDDIFTALTMTALKDLLAKQQTDTYCQRMVKSVQGKDSRFRVDEDTLICHEAHIDG